METERLHFIDRLRLIAVIILILFHTGLIFAAERNFPIKNNELSWLFEELIFFVHGWRLALLFFISGVGTSIAIQFRERKTYLKERFKRLLIPLIFGIFVIVPPQIYFERLSQGFDFGSFFNFYLQSFSTGLYPYGNMSWNHLWFVAYLLIYSVLSVPAFYLIKNSQAAWLEKFMCFGGIFIWAIPLALITALLKPHSLGVQNIVDDLAMFIFYWLIFLSGFVLHQKAFWRFIENKFTLLLTIAILLTALSYWMKGNYPEMQKGDTLYFWFHFIEAFNSWLWILVLFFFGKKHLNFPGKYLPLLNEAVYPVYILHQTAIICFGYFVVQQDWSIGAKFFLITLATIIICFLFFLLLRLNKFTRILFGMPSVSRFKGLQRNCKIQNS